VSVNITVLVQRPGQLCTRAKCHAVPDVQPGPSAGRPDRHRHQAADRRPAAASRHATAVDPRFCREPQCQPVHRGRGLRSPGRDGLFAMAPARAEASQPAPSTDHKRNEELVWLIRRLLEAGEDTILAGGPWLPNSWLDEAGIRQSLGALARKNGTHLLEYGNPFGYLPLREHLVLLLAELGITAHAGQVLLTQGTSQALELVIRYLLKPGDAALVDDPGYYNMFGNLRLQGVEMLAVPRNPDGPDIAVLEYLAAAHRPKVYFTQSVMHNPTGADTSPHAAFRVLQAAERHNFMVVEDDIFCDLQAKITPRLATLDQLNRVIYARSFSKTLSGSLRVGFIACRQDIAEDLADIKMLTSITTSPFTERL